MKMRIALALALTASTVLTGCKGQQTAADLIQVVGTAVVSLETVEGNSAIVDQVVKDTAAAKAAILAYQDGTPTEQISSVLSILEGDINLLPVSPRDQALIGLAIGTVREIVDLFPSATKMAVAHTSRPALAAPAPKNAKEFKQQWNAVLATHPELSAAALK